MTTSKGMQVRAVAVLATILIVSSSLGVAQSRKTTSEFLQSVGFSQTENGNWKNSAGATVEMNGDCAIAFTAPQNHRWDFVFGDGSKLGMTLKIGPGDVLTFKDGKISLPNGYQLQLLSETQPASISRGILKSSIFNKNRDRLSVTDIKITDGSNYSLGWLTKGEDPNNDGALDSNGNFVESVRAAEEAEAERRRKINADYDAHKPITAAIDKARAIEKYEEYCKKYGKDVIDKTINGDIAIGAPWELLTRVIGLYGPYSSYTYKLICDVGGEKQYEISPVYYEPNTWHTHYRVLVGNDGLITFWFKKNRFY